MTAQPGSAKDSQGTQTNFVEVELIEESPGKRSVLTQTDPKLKKKKIGPIAQDMETSIDEDFGYNITLLSVSCEENQCSGGIEYVIDNHLTELNPVAVFGEGPTELTNLIEFEFKKPVFGISVVHKKPLWIELELKSKTQGHGSITPSTYANKELVAALEKLTRKKPKVIYNDINIKFLKDLSTYYSGSKKLALKNPKVFKPFLNKRLRDYPELFSLFTNTITLTNIYTNRIVHLYRMVKRAPL